jgi:hypothetical protein
VYQRNLVLEIPVTINVRMAGKSTIGMRTAFDTYDGNHKYRLFYSIQCAIFFPLSVTFILIAIIWEIPIFLKGYGISIGSLLGFMTGIIFFLLGLIAEQLGNIRDLK